MCSDCVLFWLTVRIDPGGHGYDTVKEYVEKFIGWITELKISGYEARRPRPDVVLSAYDAAEHTSLQVEVDARNKRTVTIFTELEFPSVEFVEKPKYLASFRGRCTNKEVCFADSLFLG
jgi:hypothetical protein